MLFMVIERFRDGDVKAVYDRFTEHGRMMPDGLDYVDSWVELDSNRCFQLMQTDNPALLQLWTKHWDDLVDFEIVPVITSKEAAAIHAAGDQLQMSSRLIQLIVVLLLCVVPSHTLAQRRTISASDVDSQRLSMIPARLREFVEGGSMAGAVVLVARRGRVVMLEAVGYQELEGRKPMRTDTIFDIRSVTKPITAIGIMILVEDGKLALNDPVEKYLPEFKAVTDQSPLRITIHHLLTHTAALPLYRLPESETMPIKRDRTLRDYVSLLANQNPEYEPGTKFRYSSGGFAILGRIIEAVTGKSYEEFMRERIFVPLGMKDSSFFVPLESSIGLRDYTAFATTSSNVGEKLSSTLKLPNIQDLSLVCIQLHLTSPLLVR